MYNNKLAYGDESSEMLLRVAW